MKFYDPRPFNFGALFSVTLVYALLYIENSEVSNDYSWYAFGAAAVALGNLIICWPTKEKGA